MSIDMAVLGALIIIFIMVSIGILAHIAYRLLSKSGECSDKDM